MTITMERGVPATEEDKAELLKLIQVCMQEAYSAFGFSTLEITSWSPLMEIAPKVFWRAQTPADFIVELARWDYQLRAVVTPEQVGAAVNGYRRAGRDLSAVWDCNLAVFPEKVREAYDTLEDALAAQKTEAGGTVVNEMLSWRRALLQERAKDEAAKASVERLAKLKQRPGEVQRIPQPEVWQCDGVCGNWMPDGPTIEFFEDPMLGGRGLSVPAALVRQMVADRDYAQEAAPMAAMVTLVPALESEDTKYTIRGHIEEFARDMEHQLRRNDHKTGWNQDDEVDLFHGVTKKVAALERQLTSDGTGSAAIVKTAVDAANFLMMIAHLSRDRRCGEAKPTVEQLDRLIDAVEGTEEVPTELWPRGTVPDFVAMALHRDGNTLHGMNLRTALQFWRGLHRPVVPQIHMDKHADAWAVVRWLQRGAVPGDHSAPSGINDLPGSWEWNAGRVHASVWGLYLRQLLARTPR